MEERNLVYRERDAGDRRIVRIWLTPEGKQLQDILPAIGAETIDKATIGISKAQQALVLEVLDQIILNLS